MEFRELTDLELTQEAFHNIYKDRYGIRPRFVTEEQFNSIEWLEAEISFMCSEEDELRERVIDPKELGYFEELLANLGGGDE